MVLAAFRTGKHFGGIFTKSLAKNFAKFPTFANSHEKATPVTDVPGLGAASFSLACSSAPSNSPIRRVRSRQAAVNELLGNTDGLIIGPPLEEPCR